MNTQPTYEPFDDQATIDDYTRFELSGFTDEQLLAELAARLNCRKERIELALRGVQDDSN